MIASNPPVPIPGIPGCRSSIRAIPAIPFIIAGPGAGGETDNTMSKTFKMLSLVGESERSLEHAVESAIVEAASSIRNLGWFEVGEIRGRIADGKPSHWQVKVDVGFKVE